jgi:hypothetical protein
MFRGSLVSFTVFVIALGGTARADLKLDIPRDPKADALVLGVLVLTDDNSARWVRDHNNSHSLHSIADNTTRYLDPVKLTGACLVASQLLKDRTQQTRYKLAATAAFETGLITELLKHVTHRRRPDEKFALGTNPNAASSYSSFPSGHAAGDFAILTVLAQQDRENRRLYVGLGVLVCASRVYLERHYLSDVVGGAVIGTLVGKHTAKHHRGLLSWRF